MVVHYLVALLSFELLVLPLVQQLVQELVVLELLVLQVLLNQLVQLSEPELLVLLHYLQLVRSFLPELIH